MSKTVIQTLRDALHAKESGTMYVNTDNGHAGIISYQNGAVVGAVTGQQRGVEALQFLVTAEHSSYRIHPHSVRLPDSQLTADEGLRILGLTDTVNQPLPTSAADMKLALEPAVQSQAFAIIAKHLVEFAGPIAAMLVDETEKSFAAATPDPREFERVLEVLAQEIGDAEEAQLFLQRSRTELTALLE